MGPSTLTSICHGIICRQNLGQVSATTAAATTAGPGSLDGVLPALLRLFGAPAAAGGAGATALLDTWCHHQLLEELSHTTTRGLGAVTAVGWCDTTWVCVFWGRVGSENDSE